MNKIEEPDASSFNPDSRVRTPAYTSFDSNTDKVSHVLQFILHGIHGYSDELRNKIAPDAMRIAKEMAKLGTHQGKEARDQEAINSTETTRDDLIQRLSDTLVKPSKYFTGGLLTVREWIPVLLVTTVEAYLKDVLIYAANLDPALTASSEQSASLAEVTRAQSLEALAQELRSRWARNFVDDGGPERWITKLTRMGARGYRPEAASEMETLWGVRHLIVHSSGVATAEFVRRHSEISVKVGESILIRSAQLTTWITVVYHFVDITDFYFAQRAAAASSAPLRL